MVDVCIETHVKHQATFGRLTTPENKKLVEHQLLDFTTVPARHCSQAATRLAPRHRTEIVARKCRGQKEPTVVSGIPIQASSRWLLQFKTTFLSSGTQDPQATIYKPARPLAPSLPTPTGTRPGSSPILRQNLSTMHKRRLARKPARHRNPPLLPPFIGQDHQRFFADGTRHLQNGKTWGDGVRKAMRGPMRCDRQTKRHAPWCHTTPART